MYLRAIAIDVVYRAPGVSLYLSHMSLQLYPGALANGNVGVVPSISCLLLPSGWLGSRVVSVLDSGAEGPGFKSQPRRCRLAVLGKLFTPIVPLFTKQRNW